MKLRAKLMIRFNKILIKPGETFEAPQSQGIVMIQNGFAVEDKKGKAEADAKEEKTVKELVKECEKRGIKAPNRANKDTLIALIKEYDEKKESKKD